MDSSLLYRYITDSCTEQERALVEEWAAADPAHRAMLSRLADPAYVARQLARRGLVSTQRPMADMQRRIDATRHRFAMRAISIAASVIAVIGVTFIYLNHISGGSEPLMASAPAEISPDGESQTLALSEIKHGTTQARLLTSSGETLHLTAADTSYVAEREVLAIADASTVPVSRSLCLDVPRGGEFKVILEDSTEVWLNSETTLVYPESFGENERRVTLTGEAYFSVKKDATRPFCVDTEGQTVKVYGTAFNVRAYPDDPYVYTTLEQGSISIARADLPTGEVKISPGRQALLSLADHKLNIRVVNPEVITGWRHGRFVFEEQPLSVIMRDLSRWYNFTYEFADPALEEVVFMGSIPRYADFVTAISIIEKAGGLRFDTDDGKVIISAAQQ